MEPAYFFLVVFSLLEDTSMDWSSSTASPEYAGETEMQRMMNADKKRLIFFNCFSLEIENPAGLLTSGYLLTAPSHQK